MLSNVFSTLFLVFVVRALGAVVDGGAGTRTNSVMSLPSSAGFRSVEMESWRSVFKRNLKDMLVERQSVPVPPPDAPVNPETLDLQVWEKETSLRCISKLSGLTEASNPAGIAICYNIPFLDARTGVFAAELRLYQVSKPDADWAQVGDNIGIGLTYRAAGVQETNLNLNITESPPGAPDLVRVFHFLGLLKQEFRNNQATADELKALLIPVVQAKGAKDDGTPLTADLATTEAAFLNGKFITDIASPSPVGVDGADGVESVPFTLPGKSMEIMPVGLIFYSTYLVIGLSVIMYGTFERRKFRDQYRRRVAQTQPGSSRI